MPKSNPNGAAAPDSKSSAPEAVTSSDTSQLPAQDSLSTTHSSTANGAQKNSAAACSINHQKAAVYGSCSSLQGSTLCLASSLDRRLSQQMLIEGMRTENDLLDTENDQARFGRVALPDYPALTQSSDVPAPSSLFAGADQVERGTTIESRTASAPAAAWPSPNLSMQHSSAERASTSPQR